MLDISSLTQMATCVSPRDLWLNQMPASLRDRAPRPADDVGLFMVIDGIETPVRAPYGGNILLPWVTGDRRFREAIADGFSAKTQVDSLDIEGVDASVLFPTIGLTLQGVAGIDPAITTAVARVYNDWLAEFCAEGDGRLFGVAMIDPRDIPNAIQEARRCVEDYGFVGAFLRPNPVMGRMWHHEDYEPLWSALEELGIPVCFHEAGAVSLPQIGPDRFEKKGMWHTCSHPMEQQMATVSIVMGGVARGTRTFGSPSSSVARARCRT